MVKEISKSRQLAAKVIYEAFKILKEGGGAMKGYDVVEKIRNSTTFNEWETHRYEKTGYIRWESILHFFTIDCMKAGYMQKNKGTWILTTEGENALKLSPDELLLSAKKSYNEWKTHQKTDISIKESEDEEIENEETFEQKQKALLSQYEESAESGLRNFIAAKNPYEFQDMVAALLKAMDYHISFIAAKGKDGGIDIVAYQDALGIKTPRIKVQVKHYPNSNVSPDAIRSLKGLLNAGEEIGLFVTSGGYSVESQRFARESNIHIKLIDGDELIELWQKYYHQLADEDKNMLPLHPIYFLGSNE
jgi:restriction system protein